MTDLLKTQILNHPAVYTTTAIYTPTTVTPAGGVSATDIWGTSYTGRPITNPIRDLDKRIRAIEDRLCILETDNKMHTKYPALKHAYDEYKLVEKLILNGRTT